MLGAGPWLRRLVAGVSPRRPGVDPTSVHVGFMAHRVETGALDRKVRLFCFKVFEELVCGSAFGV